VRVTDAAVLDRLDVCLGSMRQRTFDVEPTWEFSFDVGRDRHLPGGKVAHGIHSLYLGCMRMFRGRGVDVGVGRLIASMRDLACSAQNEFLRLRAGGVVFDGGAVLLPSQPEPHLSGLVALLVRRGGAYLGDELVKIDPVLKRAHEVSLPLLIDVRDIGLFPELDGNDSVRVATRRVRDAATPRRAITLHQLGGDKAEAASVRWVAFPRFAEGAETTVTRIGPSDALFRMAQAALNLHVWGDRGLGLMGEILSSALVVEVVGDSPRAVADGLSSWLGTRA